MFLLCYSGADEVEQSSFDASSSSTIKLNNGTVLYLREVNRFLALVCILREENFDKQGLIDYNFNCFREAIQEVFETTKSGAASSARQKQPINHVSDQTLNPTRNGLPDK